MRDIASALVHTDATLGMIPCGTGNDFARTVKVPVDAEEAADVLLNGEDRLIDVGTGAGFPGIPLKIVFPELSVVLLDSLSKRIKYNCNN